MAGLEFISEFDAMETMLAIDGVANLDKSELLEGLGALGESQTKRRIQSEKTGPDGTPWQDWSDSYASTRHGGQSLLQADGGLLESIASGPLAGDQISWGSDVVYAAVHQFGHTFDNAWGRGIEATVPAREYLGLSAANEREMEQEALLFIRDTMQ